MKEKLLLLHGAIGSSDQFKELKILLSEKFDIHALNFSGHGGLLADTEFSIRRFTDDVLDFLNKESVPAINIFGYSMGGYVALYMARHFPEKVKKLYSLATKFDWNNESAAKESGLLNADKIEEKLPAFATLLKERHLPEDWKKVLSRTAEMMLGLGADPALSSADFKQIKSKVVIAVGDKDNMVSTNEGKHVSELIPNAEFRLIKDAVHPIEKLPVELLRNEIVSFFSP